MKVWYIKFHNTNTLRDILELQEVFLTIRTISLLKYDVK